MGEGMYIGGGGDIMPADNGVGETTPV